MIVNRRVEKVGLIRGFVAVAACVGLLQTTAASAAPALTGYIASSNGAQTVAGHGTPQQQNDEICWGSNADHVIASGGSRNDGWVRGVAPSAGCTTVREGAPGWYRYAIRLVGADGTLGPRLAVGSTVSYAFACPNSVIKGAGAVRNGDYVARIRQRDPNGASDCTLRLVERQTLIGRSGQRGPSRNYYGWQYLKDGTFDTPLLSSSTINHVVYDRVRVDVSYLWQDHTKFAIFTDTVPALEEAGAR